MARAIKTQPSGRTHVARGDQTTPRSASPPWSIRRARGLQVVESSPLAKLKWLVHGFSTRPGGVSKMDGKPALNLGFTEWDERDRVSENRGKFVASLGA